MIDGCIDSLQPPMQAAQQSPMKDDLSIETLVYSNRLYHLLLESKFLTSSNDLDETRQRIIALYKEHPTIVRTERRGNLPLHHAAAWSPLSIVEIVFSLHPHAIQVRNNFGNLPLHIACCNNRNDDVIQFLIRKYPEARTRVSAGSKQIPLHKIALMGYARSPQVLGALLDGCEESLRFRDAYDETPLMSFVKQQERGCCPNSLCDELREMTMAYACRLLHGQNMKGFVKLFRSLCWDLSLLTTLCTKWPNFTKTDLGNGMRPLHVICVLSSFLGQKEAIRLLVDRDPTSLCMRDNLGRSPVHYLLGATVCQLDMLEYILRKNGDFLVMEDSRGLTPLMAAAAADAHTEIIYALLHETAFRCGSSMLASMMAMSKTSALPSS